VGERKAEMDSMDREDAPLVGLLDTYDVAIAELEELDDPAVETLLASLRTLRKRAEWQADEVSAHLLALP
jgi:hypothetical protein